jgi:transcriptional regulator with GAF, ATPase, and Fis domain
MVSKSPDTTGGSGSGIGLITKTILDKSGWKNNRMLAVNCKATA